MLNYNGIKFKHKAIHIQLHLLFISIIFIYYMVKNHQIDIRMITRNNLENSFQINCSV